MSITMFATNPVQTASLAFSFPKSSLRISVMRKVEA
jgi:hypothetical protein